MKQLFTLIILCSLSYATLNAQAVVINTPLELAGGYEFTQADFGAALDMVWTADAVFVNDGTVNPTQGCNAAINGADIMGKIALIDRGSCEFGLKCFNAEEAGAIAAIVINNAPGDGSIVMGAGELGGQVTIPCVMIPYEVGQLIRTALVTEDVNISLGDLVPPPPPANDLSMTNGNVLIPVMGIVPASQVQAEGDFVFTPGAAVENRGVNTAPNYNVDLVIIHKPFDGPDAEVYNESFSSPDTLAPGDTTELILFPEFDPFNTGAGIYEYTYSVSSDSIDNAGFNNSTTGSFTLSEQGLYSKATWDPVLQRPRVIATTTAAGGGTIEFITPLNILYGEDYKIDSIEVEVRYGPGLAGVSIAGYVYDWDDANDNDLVELEENELERIGVALFTFPSDFEDNAQYLKMPILDLFTLEETGVIIPENDKKYLVGVRYEDGGDNLAITLGFDSSIDYVKTRDWKTDMGTFTDFDYGCIVADTYDDNTGLPTELSFFGTGLTTSTGIVITSLLSDTEDLASPDKLSLNVFPNPAVDQLNARVEFTDVTDFVDYYIIDNEGSLLQSMRVEDPLLIDQQSFDVSQLPAGEYHLVTRSSFGYSSNSFIVIR